MKKVLIRLTGLLVTTAIAISGNGLVLATEVEGTGNETGTATEATAEEPKGEETSAAEETEAPAETPAEDSKSEETAAPEATPTDTEDKETPSQEEKTSEETAATEPASETEKVVTVEEKIPGEKRSNANVNGCNSNFNYLDIFNYYSANEDAAFNAIRPQVVEVANGKRTSTKFEAPVSSFSNASEYSNISLSTLGLTKTDFKDSNTITVNSTKIFDMLKEEMNFSYTRVIIGLIYSCPYEMFWYQGSFITDGSDFSSVYETTGARISFKCTINSQKTKASIDAIIFELKVTEDYRGADQYTVNTSKVAKAMAAKENADKIIAANKNKSDVEKLKAYRDAICDAVANDEAAFPINTILGGDPWQMIPVFDKDISTNAVSDGYARAFQYLCDNTNFTNKNIYALTVFGEAEYNPYNVYNIVHMDDGKNYFVDLWAYDFYQQRSHFLGGATNSNGKYNLINADGYLKIATGVKEVFKDTDAEIDVISTSDYDIGDEPEPTPDPTPEFASGHSMRLKDSIGMCFYITFPDNFDSTNCYVKFTAFDGKTSTVDYKDSEVKEGNTRLFIFYINPLEISDYITATLYYGDGKTITAEPYSAYDYIVAARDKLSNNTGLINLLNGLHAYGYYIQKSGWTDNRSHATIPDPIKFLTAADRASTVNSVSSFNLETNIGSSGIDNIVKTSMSIATTTELNIYVKPTSGTTITSSAPTTTINGEKYYQFSTGKLGPKSLGNPKTVTVKTNRGTATISVATMYYVKSALDSNKLSTNEEYAVIAFYNYYASALAYKE